ncbi:DUF2274 domain-containing protein [Bradyrhizobium sp. Arg237L]|uniref:DUF2274 domain-containing protein n=1 Tax=Bradyrhizobium sp. Arg237L TaxID=3003352 RepID=UPI00249E9B89|nr:DUF2274 domain-containing protein [Bradyrhizobium sp. Arg237L]MDI4239012.1 DUF2274 domain-containing protein [Bradyrhizobium sp. Arg237L]
MSRPLIEAYRALRKANKAIDAIRDDKPVRVTHELPASVHRDLVTYAEVLTRESGQPINEPVKLIAPMLARSMATDRAFAKARQIRHPAKSGHEP